MHQETQNHQTRPIDHLCSLYFPSEFASAFKLLLPQNLPTFFPSRRPRERTTSNEMFAIMPPPIFSFGHAHDASAVYRPAVSSPLSSSPIRATSTSPTKPQFGGGGSHSQIMSSPLSAREPNTCALPRVQSSPIPGLEEKEKKNNSIFKFANRETRPNPVAKKREDKQETRRRLFLQNVRQRADDKKWERRGGENEVSMQAPRRRYPPNCHGPVCN